MNRGDIYIIKGLRQKGAHLENEKMKQQSRQEDQNATRHKGKPLGFNGRYTLLALTLVLELCVCVFSSHSFWTSSSLDVPAGGVTQEEGHTGFFIHLPSAVRGLIFLARIQPFLSLVDREVEFCVLTI